MKDLVNSPARSKQSIFTLGYCALGRSPIVIGLLLHDPDGDRLWLEFPDCTDQFVEPEDLDIFEVLAQDLRDKAEELGATTLLAYLLDNMSNTLLISEPLAVESIANANECLHSISPIFGTEWPGTPFVERMLRS